MDILTAIYNDTHFDGSEDSFSFAAITDGTRVEIAFSDDAFEKKIEDIVTVSGLRIDKLFTTSKENNSEYTSEDILNSIGYNMMIDISIDDEPKQSWDDGISYLTSYIESFSDDVNFAPKFYDVLNKGEK